MPHLKETMMLHFEITTVDYLMDSNTMLQVDLIITF